MRKHERRWVKKSQSKARYLGTEAAQRELKKSVYAVNLANFGRRSESEPLRPEAFRAKVKRSRQEKANHTPNC